MALPLFRSACVVIAGSALLISCALPLQAAEGQAPDRTAIAIEALNRLKGMDLEANPSLKAAVLKVVEQVRGTPQYVELVRDFKLLGQQPGLLEVAQKFPDTAAGADAIRLLLEDNGLVNIQTALKDSSAELVNKLAIALSNVADKRLVPIFEGLVMNDALNLETRKTATRALAQTQEGATKLIEWLKSDKLAEVLRSIATGELHNARWPEIKAEADKLLAAAQPVTAEALPPIAELAKRTGDPVKGAEVYRRDTVSCIRCHQVNGEGIDFGPRLSEIGTKLGKDALYQSIIDPSAGISFGYEAWEIELKDGDEAFGLIVSETADELAVKAQTGIVSRYKKSDIVRRAQMKTSVMPTGLEQAMTVDDLVNLVEYLASLKKATN